MKRVFLTGISGFLAPHLAKRLLSEGYSVDVVGWSNIPGVQSVDSFDFLKYRYDYVIHLAATTDISNEFNSEVFFNNIIYTQQILNSPFRTIYASSTSAEELNNIYAFSKRFAEHLGKRHGNALGLRFFNIYGEGNNKGIVKRTIDSLLSKEPLILTGGDLIRDFIYVHDVVEIIMKHLDRHTGVINVGTGEGMRIKEAVRQIRDVAKEMGVFGQRTPFIVRNEKKDNSNEQLVSIASKPPKIKYTSFKEGVKQTIWKTLAHTNIN